MEHSGASKITQQPSKSSESRFVKEFYDAAAKDKRSISLTRRKQSRIYYMRNLSNWVKSILITTYHNCVLERKKDDKVNILDFCCGKGGDQKKWQAGRVDHVTFVDISAASIDICKERYEALKPGKNRDHIFSADFIAHDCTAPLKLERSYSIVSCQFALHYGFENIDKARNMLQNTSRALEDGGYFLVTIPNAYEIVKRLKQSEDGMSFGNSVYTITFDQPYTDHPPSLFGARYHFQLEGVVDCPEYLVYPPLLVAMAKEVGLQCIEGPLPFASFMRSKTLDSPENIDLLRIMDALEVWRGDNSRGFSCFPSRNGHRFPSRSSKSDVNCRVAARTSMKNEKPLVASDDAGAYAHVESRCNSLRLPVGTISKQEWEAFCIYCIFVFKKVTPNKL